MEYEQRLKYSACVSAALHAALLIFGGYRWASDQLGPSTRPSPIVLNLQPAEEQTIRRLIDAGLTTDDEVGDTDLISSANTKAQSDTEGEGPKDRPAVDRIDDFDDLGTPGTLQPTESIRAAAVPAPEQPEPAPEVPAVPPAESKPAEDLPGAVEDAPTIVDTAERVSPETSTPEEAAPQPAPEEPQPEPAQEEPMRIARAEPALPPQTQELRATRGRETGGAEAGGFKSFEAKQHELGKYMLHVRNLVEREWRTGLHLRYQGVSQAYAVLDCSIRPDGSLEYVKIVDSGSSPGYATMCKAAVERAARHFEPFPFDVPEIYRSKNLEVRWRFTYM